MKKRFYLLNLSSAFAFLSLSASGVFAQAPSVSPVIRTPLACPQGEIATDLGCVPQDPIGFVERFYGIGLGLIGMVAILFMIIGGYYIMTSQGNPTRLAIGKQYIFYSIAGLVLAIMGFVFIQIVAGDILKIPGFN